ncbi:MAG TPA: hypothetical protein VMB66_16500 [Candidatus Acidoferrales bacterium]|nr:hypothetical protein [Candidatus Acidoferrales bacterium]
MTVETQARKPFVAWLLQALLMIAVCLPTGSILGLNVKIPAFVLFSVALAMYVVSRSSKWITTDEFIFLALFSAGLAFWGLVAIFRGQSETHQIFLQLKDIASTVLLAWLCLFFLRRNLMRPEDVIKPVVYGIVALGVMKIALIAITLALKIDPIQLLGNIFGDDALVGGSIAFGLSRIEFSSDILGSFVLFALLCPSVSGLRFRRVTIVLCVLVLFVSGFLAFARYIWFLEAFAVLAALIIENRIKLFILATLAMLCMVFVFYQELRPIFEARFFSDQVSDSDLIRIEQFKALVSAIEIRPFIGKGLGAHVNEVIRNSENPYSYELQWLSLTMQFGFAGIVAILLMIAASARDLLASRHRAKPWLLLLFLLWLLSGWANPHLTSSFAGATFGMFMALFFKIRNQPPLAQEAPLV